MSSLMDKLNKVASTKEALRVTINTLNKSEVLSTDAEFDAYPDFIIPPKTYTVKIDETNPDPEAALTYMDDAVDMTPGYDGWKDTKLISSIRPCLLNKDGNVNYYLQKDNYTLKENGEPSILTGIDGDVMIEIPKMGYRLWKEDNYQYVSITEEQNKEGYCYYAHSLKNPGDCDKIYIGVYLGYQDDSRLYSYSDVEPSVNINLTNFRIFATNKGSGYSLLSFYPWTLLQCLYIIIYKNLDSQAALGQGYIDMDVKSNTGSTNINTFCYGDPNNNTIHVKFLGLEDFYGNLDCILDGLYYDNDDNIKTDYQNSIFTGVDGSNFQFSTPSGLGQSNDGYIGQVQGTNEAGFIKKKNAHWNHDESFEEGRIHYSDVGYVARDSFSRVGGRWD